MITEKKCTKCDETKSVKEFHKRKDAKDGLRSRCKECRNSDSRSYSQTEKGKAVNKLAAKRAKETGKAKLYAIAFKERRHRSANLSLIINQISI